MSKSRENSKERIYLWDTNGKKGHYLDPNKTLTKENFDEFLARPSYSKLKMIECYNPESFSKDQLTSLKKSLSPQQKIKLVSESRRDYASDLQRIHEHQPDLLTHIERLRLFPLDPPDFQRLLTLASQFKSINLLGIGDISSNQLEMLCNYIEKSNVEEIKFNIYLNGTHQNRLGKYGIDVDILARLFSAFGKTSLKRLKLSSKDVHVMLSPDIFRTLLNTQNQTGVCLFDLVDSLTRQTFFDIFSGKYYVKDVGEILSLFKSFIESSSNNKHFLEELSLSNVPTDHPLLNEPATCSAIIKSSIRRIRLAGLARPHTPNIVNFKTLTETLGSTNSIREFDFSGNYLPSLTDDNFSIFCAFIGNAKGTSLNLSQCSIGALSIESLNKLFSALATSDFSELSLSDNNLEGRMDGRTESDRLNAVRKVISNPHLRKLNLYDIFSYFEPYLYEKMFEDLAKTKIESIQLFDSRSIDDAHYWKRIQPILNLFVRAFSSNRYLLQLGEPRENNHSILYSLAPELKTIIDRNRSTTLKSPAQSSQAFFAHSDRDIMTDNPSQNPRSPLEPH